MPYIYNLVKYWNELIKTLIDLKINLQKINNSKLETFIIVIISFFMNNIIIRLSFFKKILLLANISMHIVLEIFFFIINNAKIYFIDQEISRNYLILYRLSLLLDV